MQSPLCYTWKMEPVSPPQLYEDTLWLFDDDPLTAFKSTIVKDEVTLSPKPSTRESKAEVVTKLLADLDHLDQLEDFIKEEPFSNWLEEKDELFQDIRIEPSRGYQLSQPLASPQTRFKTEELKPIPNLHIISQHHQHATQQPVVHSVARTQDTSVLLQEFENVFDAVELNHGQLTPPQSPPLTDNHHHQVLTTLHTTIPVTFTQPASAVLAQPASTILVQPTLVGQPAPTILTTTNLVAQPTATVYYQSLVQPQTPQSDLAHELAEVEELVRSRAENMVMSWETAEKNLNISPSSPSSSSSSGFSECSSDPEWIPEPVQTSGSPISPERVSRGRKRMGKPYSRAGPEDKKSRKKEQNKNAATRYRMKKKAEIEEILSEEKALADSNDKLQGQVTDIQREIKYLKGLMRDLFKAKGLLQ